MIPEWNEPVKGIDLFSVRSNYEFQLTYEICFSIKRDRTPNHNRHRYVVPTGRVVVPAGRYIVHAGKVILIVSTGRLSLVPTGRVLSPGRVK
ncbi:hypothetical protein Tco_0578818 [Tanacetum coccineum]